MTESVFPYPGGKSTYADWIINHIPEHGCFIEAFGGSGAITVNKPSSTINVFNDANSHLVNFFVVLRDRPEELVEWLRKTPYSRELQEKYAKKMYLGDPPVDDVDRAGMFFYLRYTTFGGKYRQYSLRIQRTTSAGNKIPRDYQSAIQKLERYAEKFNDVIIESMDVFDLIEKYDSDEACFYFDPPYYDAVRADLYVEHTEFDHSKFVKVLGDIDGYWLVSYSDPPPGLERYYAVEQTRNRTAGYDDDRGREHSAGGGREVSSERLVMNYDPDETSRFSTADQTTLGEIG